MRPPERILVTGAGGFIGGWIVEALSLQGYRVKAGVRRWPTAARIGRFPVTIVRSDVTDKSQVERALEEVDCVIHCSHGSWDVNVQGTENVLDAALRNNVRRVLHLSTVDVYGDVEGVVSESSPYRSTGREYGDSKIEAERVCWKYRERGLPIVILRPSLVYGPFCKLWTTKFAERLASGNWGLFKERAEGGCNLVFIHDLLSAVFLSLNSNRAVGEAFNINGPEIISWNDYFYLFNEGLGLPPLREISQQQSMRDSLLTRPLRSVARHVLRHYSPLVTALYQRLPAARQVMKRTELRLKTTPSSDEFRQFSRKVWYDISKARESLGYDPFFNVTAGLNLSIQWLRHEMAFPGEKLQGLNRN